MKKHYISHLVLISLIPLLSSCASQQDVNTLNYHVRSINKKLQDMKLNTVDQMQQRQADSSGVMDQIQSDVLELQSKIEEISHMNRMLQEQNKEIQLAIQAIQNTQSTTKLQQETELKATIAELNSKIAMQNDSLAAIQEARVKEAERKSKAAAIAAAEAMRKAQEAKETSRQDQGLESKSEGIIHIQPLAQKVIMGKETQDSPPTNEKKAASATEVAVGKSDVNKDNATTREVQDSYSKAQEKFRNGDYKGAFVLFEENASNKNDRNLAVTSRYMMGECLYKQEKFDQAIIQYQQIITNFPGNPQAAKALLRQGASFEQLSDNETAKIIYKKLTRTHPSSPEAEEAQSRIDALK